jgi:hypothetical protein
VTTPAEIAKVVAEIRKFHTNDLYGEGPTGDCSECHDEHGNPHRWPCDAIRAADLLEECTKVVEAASYYQRQRDAIRDGLPVREARVAPPSHETGEPNKSTADGGRATSPSAQACEACESAAGWCDKYVAHRRSYQEDNAQDEFARGEAIATAEELGRTIRSACTHTPPTPAATPTERPHERALKSELALIKENAALRTQLAEAREKALEEAAMACAAYEDGVTFAAEHCAAAIRALKDQRETARV